MKLDCWAMDSAKHQHDPELFVYEIHETGTIPADERFDINVSANFRFWFLWGFCNMMVGVSNTLLTVIATLADKIETKCIRLILIILLGI